MGFGEDKMPAAPGTPESLTGESGNLPGVAMTSQSMPVLSKPSVSKLVRESVSGTSDFGRVSFSKVSRTMRKVDGIREECGIPAGEVSTHPCGTPVSGAPRCSPGAWRTARLQRMIPGPSASFACSSTWLPAVKPRRRSWRTTCAPSSGGC